MHNTPLKTGTLFRINDSQAHMHASAPNFNNHSKSISKQFIYALLSIQSTYHLLLHNQEYVASDSGPTFTPLPKLLDSKLNHSQEGNDATNRFCNSISP